MGTEKQAEIVLRPKRGQRAPKFGKNTVIAFADVAENPDYLSPTYQHPYIELRVVDADGDTTLCDTFVVKFQRHRRISADTVEGQSSGFMGSRGTWSYCYAASAEFRMERARFASAAMAIIARAEDALTARRRASEYKAAPVRCDLLGLIVGLRLIGVRVEIRAPRIAQMRAERAPRAVAAPAPAPRVRIRTTRTGASHAA